jgi:hypothetical protein
MAGNPNFTNDILSTTLFNYRDTLEDNIFKANPFMYWLQRQDRFVREDGGEKLVVPLLGYKPSVNQTTGIVRSYSADDTLNLPTSSQQLATAAEYPWQQFVASIMIMGIEEAKNAGTSRIINLLEARVKQAEMTITEQMDVMFLGNGAGNSNKEWWGLLALVDTANPSRGNFGNIDRSTDTWWQAGHKQTTAEALTLARMTTAYNTVSKGNDHPDLILTEQTLYEAYEALLQPQQRFTDTEAADGGFQNLLFKGATMFFDSNIALGNGYSTYNPTGAVMFFLNSKYLSLVGHKDVWFSNTPFVRPTNQDIRVAQILSYGQLVASNCQRQGVLTQKTA